MRMRLLVFGLIMLKRTVCASVLAGHKATGQVTSDRRRCPSHDGRAAMTKNPFANPFERGLNGGQIDSLQQEQRFACVQNHVGAFRV
jgi:hypothetical protein